MRIKAPTTRNGGFRKGTGGLRKGLTPSLETWTKITRVLVHGSIKNGSAASDLPPEGPKQERWGDLTHLEHISKLALRTTKN